MPSRIRSRAIRAARFLGACVVLFVLICLGAYALIESGEVVVIRAAPDDGHGFLARLWVVDYGGDPWIGTTDPSKTDWVPWLRSHPMIELERGDAISCRRGVFIDDLAARNELNALLRAKYRIPSYGSEMLKIVGGARRDEAERVWIRLDRCEPISGSRGESRERRQSARSAGQHDLDGG